MVVFAKNQNFDFILARKRKLSYDSMISYSAEIATEPEDTLLPSVQSILSGTLKRRKRVSKPFGFYVR
jgi:hypothetical protein